MDTDPEFRQQRPHVVVLDATQFVVLFESAKNNKPAHRREDGFLKVIEGRLDLGVAYPRQDSGFPPMPAPPMHSKFPVNLQPESDMTTAVYGTNGTKRKRSKNDAMVMSLRVMNQNVKNEIAILEELRQPNKKNKMASGWFWLEPPTLTLDLEETTDEKYVFSGRITYEVWYKLAPWPPTFMLEIPGIRRLIDYLLPPPAKHTVEPKDLYNAMTADHGISDEAIDIPELQCQLLRYQNKTVKWLLKREQEISIPEWREWKDGLWINPYSGCISTHSALVAAQDPGAQILLAEEMGLGKTVETLAVILENRRPDDQTSVYDGFLNRKIPASRGTLIISPASIAAQWKDEVKRHAPGLSVMLYKGRDPGERGDVLAEMLQGYDVVITNYHVIAREVHYAFYNPSQRVRSHVVQQRDVESIQSPLVQMQFWRVILDEVQMVSSGVSAAAKVARVIPRVHAWGVTGTPVSHKMADLQGILNFLRFEPYATSQRAWDKLTTNPADFQQFFNRIGIRHTTAMVEDDISIPKQTRMLVTLQFNKIEANNYQHLYQRFLSECGMDEQGNATESFQPDNATLSSWLVRLRQACCHALVGVNKKSLGANNAKPMSTMEDVLGAMKDQARSALLGSQRRLCVSQIERGQIKEQMKEPLEALKIWQVVLDEILKVVQKLETETPINDKNERDEDERNNDRIRLRSWLELVHRCYFFIGSAHFQLYRKEEELTEGEGLTDEENQHQTQEQEYYEKAELLRRRILQEPMKRVQTATSKLQRQAENQDFVEINDAMIDEDAPGIETRGLVEKFNMVAEALNPQAEIIDEWRELLIKYLCTKLVDQNTDPDGEEYNESLDAQELAFMYLEVLQQVLSDRSLAVHGIADPNYIKSSIAKEDKTEKMVELELIRKKTQPVDEPEMAMDKVVQETRQLASSGGKKGDGSKPRQKIEHEFAQDVLPKMIKVYNQQRDELKDLGKEILVFRNLYNLRVEYYRQLQELSDNVVALETYGGTLTSRQLLEAQLVGEINQQIGRLRYLATLNSEQKADRLCIICQCDFKQGVWTSCGHEFCRPCIDEWLKHKTVCPVCKRDLKDSDLYFYVGVKDFKEEKKDEEQKQVTVHKTKALYEQMPQTTINEINHLPTLGSFRYGTKIDFMIRHLYWLREADPTAQVVIFSQWQEMLNLIARALEDHRLQYASIQSKSSEFVHNPAIACFLLHARSQSSGLTLVNARHVYLVEPLVNTAIELQAISRIHRIGQQHETKVWSFVVDDTVEESVLDLATKRRVEHMHTSHPSQYELDKSNEHELQKVIGSMVSNKSTGGEVVSEDDLWNVLF